MTTRPAPHATESDRADALRAQLRAQAHALRVEAIARALAWLVRVGVSRGGRPPARAPARAAAR